MAAVSLVPSEEATERSSSLTTRRLS